GGFESLVGRSGNASPVSVGMGVGAPKTLALKADNGAASAQPESPGPILAPGNDDCATAATLTVGTSCVNTNGDSTSATQSIAPITCAGFTSSSALDVWYKFVATSSAVTITETGSASLDSILDVRSGACNGTNIACADATLSGGTETVTATGLTVGSTYYVRVYGWAGSVGTFTICATGVPAPANDTCA